MKTSIFDMNFVLPPMVEMTQVEKDMPKMPTLWHCSDVMFPIGCDVRHC